MIKDHPKETAVPEAVRNMIEAATAYKPNETVELKIRKLDIASSLIGWEEPDGKIIDHFKNKLSFLNPGGMSATELTTAFTKIGSSVGKENSLDRNYGQGIRTSVLYWSELLCITYKNGVAHYVWLGKEELGGNDFQIEIKSADGTYMVQECTDWVVENANQREYNLDEDFTEVILLGKEANPTQDTFLDPYGNPKKQEPTLWLRKAIYTRFWKMPENVKLMLHASVLAKEGAKKNTGYRDFMTFLDCIDYKLPKVEKKPKGEIVKVQEGPYRGARIHYYHDAPLGDKYKNPNAPYSTFKSNDNGWAGGNISGIILKNEMYDVKDDSSQEQSSLIKLGIHKDHRNFKIMFELPQDAGYTYDMYRMKVLNGQEQITFDDDVLQDIVDNMPKWFNDLVAETKIKSKIDLNEAIKERIAAQKSLFNPLAGMTTNGNGGMTGQTGNKNPNPTPRSKPTNRKPIIRNRKGNKSGEPILPEIIPNPSVTEPFFAKVEGTRNNPQLFTNPEWKKLETLASQLDVEGTKGRWYLRAKELLENAFTIDAVVWYLNALSENLQGNLSAEEYQDTIAPKSINMFLSTIGSSVFEDVKDQVFREIRSENKEFRKTEEVEV
jgi:hypothetical protein